uniref:Uncharacterized protein n=1 Tax=Arundo donax TaxID=35708 RepID=A0A0A9D0H2_ARUDO
MHASFCLLFPSIVLYQKVDKKLLFFPGTSFTVFSSLQAQLIVGVLHVRIMLGYYP